ncbi:MAG: hypothetical protein HGB10_00295 [Coriobacteriia bacterium]|nr:hypothetical protein [Coriobacteriia bacterium]
MYRAEGSRFIECDADDEITEVPLDPNESVTRAAIAELSKLGPVKVQELADFLGKHRSTITERVKKYGYSIKRGIVLAPNVGGEVRTTNNNPPTHSSGGVDGDGGGPPKGGPPPTTNHSPALDIPEIERESER